MNNKTVSLVVSVGEIRNLLAAAIKDSQKFYRKINERNCLCIDFKIDAKGDMIHTVDAIDQESKKNPFSANK